MNKQKRERLKDALRDVDSAARILQGVCGQEEDCLDNCPENLQSSERYERMEETVEALGEAIDKLDEVRETIISAIQK